MLGCLGINISHHKNIAGILKENQYKVKSQSIPIRSLRCFDHHHEDEYHMDYRFGNMAQEELNEELAIDAYAKLFPDYAITFEQVKTSGSVKQKNLEMQLKYTIHMYAYHDHDPHNRYKWATILYKESYWEEHHDYEHVWCQSIRPSTFIPSIYFRW